MLEHEIIGSIPASGTDAELARRGFDLRQEYLTIIRHAGLHREHTVLELATGPGRAPAVLSRLGYRVITGDLSLEKHGDMLARVTPEYLHLMTVCQLDMAALPFRSGSVRSIVCINTIHELSDPESCLRELNRVQHPEGALVIADFSEEGFDLMDEVHMATHGSLHDRGTVTLRDLLPLIGPAYAYVGSINTPLNSAWVLRGKKNSSAST